MPCNFEEAQWLFPLTAFKGEGSKIPFDTNASSTAVAECELRARGIEFLFRVGVQLQLPLSAILTASVYFHRFYMRVNISDYPPYCVASASIFMASKSEECGRRLKDVAMVCMSKAMTIPSVPLDDDIPEVEKWQNTILKTEELLLEALGFDFVVVHPHAVLAEMFTHPLSPEMTRQEVFEDLAWSIATDSFRTPLCVLFDPIVIAFASLALAIAVVEAEDLSRLQRLLDEASGHIERREVDATPGQALFNRCLDHYKPSIFKFKSSCTILLQYYRSQWLPAISLAPGQDHFLAPIASLHFPKDVLSDTCFFIHSAFSETSDTG